MGMDVYGLNPSSEAGKYFRNSCWWWRPLWEYCLEMAPHLCKDVSGQTNDGDGLDASDSEELADILAEQVKGGYTQAYAVAREAQIKAMPNEDCWCCEGVGTRSIPVEEDEPAPEFKRAVPSLGEKKTKAMKCNVCNGSGKVRPQIDNYPFSVENVKDFIKFLRGCGGFEIC